MLKLFGLDSLVLKVVGAGIILAAVGGLIWAVTSWWDETKRSWQEVGRMACQLEVEAAYNRGLRENLEKVKAAVEAENRARQEMEELRAAMEMRERSLEEELDAQELEMAGLRARRCESGEQLIVPSEAIDLLNRRTGP